MATTTPPATTATADCGDPATKVEPQPDVTRLCMFNAPKTAAETFMRTAHYAQDPKGYLVHVLGQDVFDQRKDLLSIPDVVDRDAYGNGTHKTRFEKHVAQSMGKTHGLFFITGVQAQLSALKIHCERSGNPRLAWHVSCHIESAELRAFETLYGLERVLLGSNDDALPTVDEIMEVLALPQEKRTAAVVLEVPNRTLGCQTYTFDELCRISTACKSANVVLHLDGARIWEIEPYYQVTAGKSFRDIAQLFDTVYVSFYKGLGGITGAMLLSDDASFIADAKTWQRRAGGNAHTLAYEIIDCERGFNESIGTFARKRDKMIEVVNAIKPATKAFRGPKDDPIVQFTPEEATCCQIRTLFNGYTLGELYAARDRVQDNTGIRVFDRAFPKKTSDEKMAAERAGVEDDDEKEFKRQCIEWMMMNVTEKVPTQTFVDGYVALCQELTNAST